jgi:acyl transferase domain-containing protein
MFTENNDSLSPSKRALLKIHDLKQQLAELQRQQTTAFEPVAIVSMACRFPRRSRTPEEFWRCLIEQTDEVGEIPQQRWDLEAFYDADPEVPGKMYARHGVFLDNLDLMDPEFFGISPREATWVDPQQRLLMEVGWEAIERAGWLPEKIAEHTGVFVGWMHNDYQNEASDSFLNLNPYIATGAAGSFLCGRLAYYLGLQGPSVAVDTACSSSLVALHLACQSLQRRDCDRALVGGVNAICSPTTNILTCKLKALSPTGQSRAFDAAADGYLRGEGCGVVTLRRLSDAQRDGDSILGIIRGSAIGHNGFSSGLTAPNPKAQEKVIRQALERAGIAPHEVSYLEAHGTGTELGDPIEMQAAAAALASGRSATNPLLVGSVKTNIGHLEAAAGMAGLIKVLLAIEYNQIPGQRNFENPNPHIAWDSTPVKVLTEVTDWPAAEQRIAGVSAFGMSGTNAHLVIEAPGPIGKQPGAAMNNGKTVVTSQPAAAQPASASGSLPAELPAQLLVLSGTSDEAVHQLAENLARRLADNPGLSLVDIAYTSGACRKHFDRRAAMVVRDHAHAVETLNTLARGGSSPAVFQGNRRRSPIVAWQFTGQGAQYLGMAAGLYESEPLFRDAIDHCDALLQNWRNESLTDVLFGTGDQIHHTHWTQPCLFAIQMGLAKLLHDRGLFPDMVWGHSVGQYAAACVAGIMSWDDGLRLISERGRLIGQLPSGGRMLAVFAPLSEVQPELNAIDGVSLAALNGTHIVLSGSESDVDAVEGKIAARGIRCKRLTTSHAFHSSLMDPALEPFRRVADQIEFNRAKLPLICNITGKVLNADATLDGQYWAQHIRQAVRFSDSIEAAQASGCEIILEIGPQPVLTRMAAASWRQPADRLISCLKQDADDSESFLHAIGQLYVHGATPDFDAMYRNKAVKRLVLPTYPFQRRRFWGPDKPSAFHAEFHTAHPLLGARVSLAGMTGETRFESFIDTDSPPWLPDHEVMGQVVMPGAAYVEMAFAATGSGQIQDIVFEQPLQPTARTALQTIVRSGDGQIRSIETYSATAGTSTWKRNFSATVGPTEQSKPATIDVASLRQNCPQVADPNDFYAKLQEIGLNYGPQFRTIHSLQYSDTEVLAQLRSTGDIRGFTIPPTILDGALHALAVGLLRSDDDNLFLPIGIGAVTLYQPIDQEVWCHARWQETDGKIRTADLKLFNHAGDVVVQIDRLQVRQISRAALRQISGDRGARSMYELQWQSYRLPASNTATKQWLIVNGGDAGPLADELTQNLIDKGHRVVRLDSNTQSPLMEHSASSFMMSGESPENWEQLFAALSTPEHPYAPQGIAWLFGSDPSSDNRQNLASLPAATETNCRGLLNLIHCLQRRKVRQIDCGLQLITRSAVAVAEREHCDASQTQYWGLGRVIGAEQPEFRCRLIDFPAVTKPDAHTSAAVTEILLTETRDNQLAVRDSQYFVPRMKPLTLDQQNTNHFSVTADGCHLITGGLGMLGRQAAKWLADHGASQVVLVSRRAPDPAARELLDQIAADGCEVVVHPADLGSLSDVEKLFQRFGTDLKPLRGVIHAAGVLDDALIDQQSWKRFQKVLAPKIVGASLLHEFSKDLPLDYFILYSSAAAVLGSPGQSNYATANAFLDGLAWQRRSLGLPALSINWGPWSEGMADDERITKRLALQGIVPLSVTDAHHAMERMLAANQTQATVIDVDWRRLQLGLGGESPAMLTGLAPERQRSQLGDSQLVSKLKQLRSGARKELLVKTIQDSMQGILSTPEPPEIDRPLIEMGLDSLMAVEFSTELQIMIGEQFAIGPTMLFEHPSIDAIADHVLSLVAGDAVEQTAETTAPHLIAQNNAMTEREPIAIIGMSCRFPGARDVNEFWSNLLNGVDSVGEIPEDRWDIDQFYSAEHEPGKMYTREGGFLDDIADFDAAFFNISDQEACWIDPQHRMLLENSYCALEDAGISPSPLADANVGVFMGIMGQDYAFLPRLDDEQIIKAFQGAGLSHSAGVGRISYVFGFEGPCLAVDTASSSSLVALYQAVRSLQDGNCNMALAGGANAILAPVNSLLMSKAALLSPDGRCKSFSAQANGFGRGEGCGVVVLKRLSDAQRDSDRIMAVVRGGAVVHNGFSGGITSPSGKSQARVITQALQDARIAPSQVQYLEAHGTGTELGDPMELAAAAAVYGKGRQPDQPLLVGSVKANISHLEAAGGVSGLIKTVLALHHGVIPPQVHFEQPSPHIPWNRLPVKIVAEQTDWPAVEERIAAVTALGLVGTNAHVVLSAAPAITPPPRESNADTNRSTASVSNPSMLPARPSQLLVLSARNERALEELAASYHQFMRTHPELDLADICHTAAIGRRHYEHRLAINASSVESVLQKLSSLGRTATFHDPQLARGFAKAVPKLAWAFTGDQNSDLAVARELYAVEPVFRELMDDFDQRLSEHYGTGYERVFRLRDWMTAATHRECQQASSANLLLFALQSGLARLWQSWGVEPDAVFGFGIGQYTAACVAGGLSFSDALMLVVHRESSLDQFEALADTFNYYPPNLPLVCSLSAQTVPVHRSLGGSYWRRHLTEAPQLADGLRALTEMDCDFLMEIGPDHLRDDPRLANWNHESDALLPSVNHGQNVTATMLATLGRLYVSGLNPAFKAYDAHWPRRRIGLPHYPFQKKRYWITEVAQYLEPAETVIH